MDGDIYANFYGSFKDDVISFDFYWYFPVHLAFFFSFLLVESYRRNAAITNTSQWNVRCNPRETQQGEQWYSLLMWWRLKRLSCLYLLQLILILYWSMPANTDRRSKIGLNWIGWIGQQIDPRRNIQSMWWSGSMKPLNESTQSVQYWMKMNARMNEWMNEWMNDINVCVCMQNDTPTRWIGFGWLICFWVQYFFLSYHGGKL